MTVKLSTTINNIERDVINSENKQLLLKFFDFMKRAGTSEKYQNNNLKALIAYSKSLEPSLSFYEIENKSQIISFLDTKIKNSEDDPDKRWITTWNDYLVRIKYFFRWLYNCKDKDLDDVPFSDWETPDLVKIKNKKTKRISPYLENELCPIKFINNIHKAIAAISTSEIDKSLNTLTNIQVSILKAENLIFKAAVGNPQVMQQIHTVNYVVPTPQPEKIQQVDTSKNVVPTPQPEKIQQVDTSKNVVPTPQPQEMQQFDTLETNTIADDFTSLEDS